MKKIMVLAALVAVCFAATTAWAGMLQIKGSTTVLPIAQEVAEAYMSENPSVKISLSGGGTSNGIKALIDGTTDIANASRFIKNKEVSLAVGNGRYPVPFAVAYDSIIPIVHPSNPVANLTLAQLKGIYKGEIANWKDLGGPDKKIVIISRDTSSGTYETWEEKVMKKERVHPGALLQASNGAVAQAVAGNTHALGYIGIGYLNDSVKGLTVEGVQGSFETTLNGTYPISRALYMFTSGWPEGEVLDFINYVLHPAKGQPLVKKSGYVPLY